jgi:deazaflavin-dependent oxidoreductase (nitroreductase family)
MPLRGDYEPGTSAWAREQAERFEASDGTEKATLSGKPIVVVTSVGAVTGKLRKTAVMRVEHDGSYAAVASRGGAAKDPKWAFNLRANPHVELQDGATRRDYRAHVATGSERAAWWKRAVDVWPAYAGYQQKTSREIPVFVLEPIEGAG